MEATAPEKEEIFYNADVSQIAQFLRQQRGRSIKLIHHINAVSDDLFIETDKQRKLKLKEADLEEIDDASASKVEQKSDQAAIECWLKICPRVENYALRNGEVNESNFRQVVPDDDKIYVVNSIVFAAEIVPLPRGDNSDLFYVDDVENVIEYHLRCYFNGYQLLTKHFMRPVTAGQSSDFRGLMQQAYLVQGTKLGEMDQRIPSRVRKLGRLYDDSVESTEGYVGRVPLWHKKVVAEAHFKQEQKLLAKN